MSEFVTVDRTTLEQLVVELQRMSSACELEGDKHRNGNKWHRLCDDADKALTAGRAALGRAERKAEREHLANEPTGPLGVRTGPMEWSKP